MSQQTAHIEANRKAAAQYRKYLETEQRADGIYIRDTSSDNIPGDTPDEFGGPFRSEHEAIRACMDCIFPAY